MSGLDDSLSDVGAKKKYPFELEKAIHNVMFIQHHMTKQDEFNAVSGSQTWFEFVFCTLQEVCGATFFMIFYAFGNSFRCGILSLV